MLQIKHIYPFVQLNKVSQGYDIFSNSHLIHSSQ